MVSLLEKSRSANAQRTQVVKASGTMKPPSQPAQLTANTADAAMPSLEEFGRPSTCSDVISSPSPPALLWLSCCFFAVFATELKNHQLFLRAFAPRSSWAPERSLSASR